MIIKSVSYHVFLPNFKQICLQFGLTERGFRLIKQFFLLHRNICSNSRLDNFGLIKREHINGGRNKWGLLYQTSNNSCALF